MCIRDRVSIVDGRVQFQSLDKYRGDGAGNTDARTGQFTQQQITDFNTIDRLYELYKDDTDQLTKLIQRFDAETLAAYRRFKKGDE